MPAKTAADLPAGVGRQAIEGNALTDDEIRMFEMFEREGWSPEQRRAYIHRASKEKPGHVDAAEFYARLSARPGEDIDLEAVIRESRRSEGS